MFVYSMAADTSTLRKGKVMGSKNERSVSAEAEHAIKMITNYNSLLKVLQPNTQTYDVAMYLMEHGSITSWQAIQMFGATRLSDIIYRLRKRGFIIRSERETVKTRYGSSASIVTYTLRKGENQNETPNSDSKRA